MKTRPPWQRQQRQTRSVVFRVWLFKNMRSQPASRAALVGRVAELGSFGGARFFRLTEVGEERRSAEDEAARKERILADLLASLDAVSVNREEVRFYLTQAKREGLDWKELYEEALQIQRSVRPEQADLIPPTDDVRPLE